MDKCCPAEVRLLDGCEIQLGISPWALGSSKVVVVVRMMAGVVLNHRQQLDLPLPFYARFLLCYLIV